MKVNNQEILDTDVDEKPTSSQNTFWKKILLKSEPINGEEK